MIQANSMSLFSEMMPQVKGGATMTPKQERRMRNRTPFRTPYGTVFVNAKFEDSPLSWTER